MRLRAPTFVTHRTFQLATAVVLLLIMTSVYVASGSARRSPELCQRCHAGTHASETWASSPHRQVACGSCHNEGLIHAVQQTGSRRMPAKMAVQVSDQPCRVCHINQRGAKTNVEDTPGHEEHARAKGVTCLSCHASGPHRFGASVTTCSKCHQQTARTTQPSGQPHCLACHTFIRQGGALAADRAACQTCHQKSGIVRITYGKPSPMVYACQVCHHPHTERKAVQDCTRCHPQSIVATTPKAHQDCVACHKPHSWRVEDLKACLSCHSPLSQDVQAHRIPNHPQRFCVDCHQPHGWKFAGTQTCDNCHKQRKAVAHPLPWIQGHQGPAKQRGATCQTCHQQSFCSSCHSRMQPSSHQLINWKSTLHGDYSLQKKEQCSVCHSQSFCQSCHGLTMPHPAGWLHSHGDEARNRQLCQKCHSTSFCNRCHGGPNMMPPDHVGNWRVLHGRKALARGSNCLTCHRQSQCQSCHGVAMPHPAGWLPTGHARLASFQPGSTCFRCHQQSYCKVCHTNVR